MNKDQVYSYFQKHTKSDYLKYFEKLSWVNYVVNLVWLSFDELSFDVELQLLSRRDEDSREEENTVKKSMCPMKQLLLSQYRESQVSMNKTR